VVYVYLEFKCPLKSQIFMWLVPMDKALTWDHLQKRCRFGPSECHLCRENEENIYHLLFYALILCRSGRRWKNYLT
jgi:hypothetical protein